MFVASQRSGWYVYFPGIDEYDKVGDFEDSQTTPIYYAFVGFDCVPTHRERNEANPVGSY